MLQILYAGFSGLSPVISAQYLGLLLKYTS